MAIRCSIQVNSENFVVIFWLNSWKNESIWQRTTCTDNIDGAPEHMQGIIDMFTDPNFLHSAYKLNNYLVKQEIPVYQYMFTYQGTVYILGQ